MKTTTQSGKALIIWVIIAFILAGGLLALKLMQPPPPPALQKATWLPDAKSLEPFALTDHNGEAFVPASLQGQWSLIFFGYTHCPDVCPTTMNDLNAMLKVLKADHPQTPLPHVIFVSVDPERDTAERLKQYVPYFNEQFLGVTGEIKPIIAFSRDLNAFFRYNRETPDSKDYIVDHSAGVNLIDPDGRLHAIFMPPLDPRVIASDYTALTQYYEATH